MDRKKLAQRFGLRLRTLRRIAGLTQEQLAERAGFSYEHINKLERGAAAPSFKVVEALSGALQTQPAQLFLFEDDEKSLSAFSGGTLEFISQFGTWCADLPYEDIWWSESLYKLFGFAPGEVKPGFDVLDQLVLDEDKPTLRRMRDSFGTEPIRNVMLCFRRRDGECRRSVWCGDIVYLDDGAPRAFVGVTLDVTELLRYGSYLHDSRGALERIVEERTSGLHAMIWALNDEIDRRRRSEATLRAREAAMRLLTDALPVLVAHCDAEGRYLFANKAYAEFHSPDRLELAGRRIADVLGAELYAHVESAIQQALAGRRAELSSLRTDSTGALRLLQAEYIPHADQATGRVDSYYVLVHDITGDHPRAAQPASPDNADTPPDCPED